MYKKICASCMAAYDSDQAACPYCGASGENHNPEGGLPEGLLLNDTYRVGTFVSIDGEGAIYEAVDVVSHRAYRLKEYMPITLCSGRGEDLALQVRVGSEVPYKNNAADFADLYARLRHFNNDICLIGVREVFYANNTVYAVTEKAEGLTLTEYLEKKGGRLGWEEALDLLDPLWVALERLHRAGIIHRGICCDNITVTGPGIVRLGGYATQAMRSQGTELKAQLYSGYAAPEQYTAAAFDGAFTDVYALSAVLYRVVTGINVPNARERVHEDLLEDPTDYADRPLPDGSVQRLPLYLADAILHGLQLEGSDRFEDMTSFRTALAGQQAQRTAAQRPARAPGGAVHTEPEKKGLWSRMSTDVKVGVCTGAFLLLAFLIVLLIWYNGRHRSSAESASLFDSSSSMSESDTLSASESGSSSASDSDLAPQLVGMKYADARLQYPDLRMSVSYDYSATVEVGVIISQSPEQRQKLDKNAVTIVVSQGVEPIPLPDIEGYTQASAESLLQSLGIKYTIVTVINDGSWAEGVVTETDPAANTMLQPGTDSVIVRVASAKPAASSSAPPPSSSQAESASAPAGSSESVASSEPASSSSEG